MRSAGVLGTVTYFRWGNTLRSKLYVVKIPQKSTALWVKFVMSSLWTVVWFLVGLIICGGCVSIDNDPRPGRPRTSTDERNVKLVADTLEEDCRATCEELSRTTGAKTSQENAQEPTSVAHGWTTHSPWQCSPAHSRCCNQKPSRLWVGSITSCTLQSRQSPPDFDLFPKRTYACSHSMNNRPLLWARQ